MTQHMLLVFKTPVPSDLVSEPGMHSKCATAGWTDTDVQRKLLVTEGLKVVDRRWWTLGLQSLQSLILTCICLVLNQYIQIYA